jgi:flagellar hook protein FlgE
VEYFDNLGTSQNIEVTYTPVVQTVAGSPATNTWHMVMRDSAGGDNIIGSYELTFDATRGQGGTLVTANPLTVDAAGAYDAGGTAYGLPWDPATGDLTVEVAGAGANPVTIGIGAAGDASGITQLSDSFAPTAIAKDGSPVGNMTGVEIDPNGFVRATFDTGITRTLYQIPLVDLPNPNELTSLDNQTYTLSNKSGSFFLWDAADGPTGDIVSYALEESTVDVAGELTSLIQTQRAYSSNAKVIQTVDEMLQETTNIKR